MIRGKSVADAKVILTHITKKARHPLHDLLDSAVANATHNFKIEGATLFVKEIRVDQGYVLKRSLPMARGSAFPLKKRTSHVTLVLAPAAPKKVKAAKAPKVKAVKSAAK